MFADLLKVESEVGNNFNLTNLKTAVTAGAICSEQLINEIKTKLHFKFVYVREKFSF